MKHAYLRGGREGERDLSIQILTMCTVIHMTYYLLYCGWRVFRKVRQMWVGPQCGGCVSMTGDGVSGWRVEMWRTCEQEESRRG